MAQVLHAPKNAVHLAPPTSPDVSVCIANWNCVDLLRRCLQSLFDQPQGAAFEVVIASHDAGTGTWSVVAADRDGERPVVLATSESQQEADDIVQHIADRLTALDLRSR